MPELPEVELATRRLRAVAEGRRIVAARVMHPALRRQLGRGDLAAVRRRRIERVERRGKYQLLHLEGARTIVAHFRMSGDWHIAAAGSRRPPYARAELTLDDGTRIVLADARALSSLTVAHTGREPLPRLGPDPLTRAFTAGALGTVLARRRGPIKPALLDQSVAAGVGNIYASEALWRARIHPAAPASSLGRAELRALVAAIREVLRDALRDAGRYDGGAARAHRFEVYDRAGESCRRCGSEIRRLSQAGRSTYFCPGCQKL
jgi:formamidopyrimidine-DNA glycosylase